MKGSSVFMIPRSISRSNLIQFWFYSLGYLWLFGQLFSVGVIQAEQITSTKLENGLEILVKVDRRAPVAAVMVWYRAGSIDEVTGKTGVAHVLEHMMFQGTKTIPKGEFAKKIASVGGRSNAFTSSDYTGYFEELHSDELEMAIRLEADRMSNLIITEEDFETEVKVVMEERRQRVDDNPSALMMERMSAVMYVAHPYRNPIIGWMNDLENLTVDDAVAWYQDWYSPSNAALVVSGDVDPAEVIRLASKYFGAIASKKIPTRRYQSEPRALGEKRVTVKGSTTIPTQSVGYRVPRLENHVTDWEPYALYLLAGVLDGYSAARLPRSLVNEKRIAVSVSASYDGLKRGPGGFYVGFSPSPNASLETLERAWREELMAIQSEGVTNDELDRVKAQVIAGQVYSEDSVLGQASRIGRMWSVGLPETASATINEKLKEITPDQVKQVAIKYLNEDNMTVGVLLPQ